MIGRRASSCALLAALLAAGSSGASRADEVRYSDTEFLDADWSVTPEVVGGVGSVLATHWPEFGFPGACVHVEHRVTKNPDAGMATQYVFHARAGASHLPARDGAILWFDFSMVGLKSRSGAVTAGPAARQDGTLFWGPGVELEKRTHGTIAIQQFGLGVNAFRSIAHPGRRLDTSPLGGEIEFGFFTASGTTLEVPRFSETELDDWVFVVHREQPVPAIRSSWGRIRRLYR